MKKLYFLLVIAFCLIPDYCFAQANISDFFDQIDQGEDDYPGNNNNEQSENSEYNPSSGALSLLLGGGAMIVETDLYELPTINQSDYTVQLEPDGRLRSSLSIGISYTFFRKDDRYNSSLLSFKNEGMSVALFVNPVNVDSLLNSSSFLQVDLGFGIGYRWNSFTVMAAVDFFQSRQPRDYFIEQFSDGNSSYVVNQEVQTSIDYNDDSIFKSTVAISYGIKLCFNLDLLLNKYRSAGISNSYR